MQKLKKTQFGVLSSKIIHHTSTDINIYSKKIRRYAKYASIEHINENKKDKLVSPLH